MANKMTLDDILQDLTEYKLYYFSNGFFYDSQGNLMSREKVRQEIGYRYKRYKIDDIDKFEETIQEFNRKDENDPRAIYLGSIKPIEGKSWLLGWLETEYPQYDWKQIFWDLIMHKSPRVYILYGIAEAGKSKILDILRLIFAEYTKSFTIDQLSNRFNLGEVIGRLFIVGDDLGKENFGSVVGLIKSMATGEPISLERKFMHSIECKNEGNFAFGCNQFPYLDINDDGVLRRFVVLIFDKKMKLPVQDYAEFVRDYINPTEAGKLLYQVQQVKHDPAYFNDKLHPQSKRYMLHESPVHKAGTEQYEVYSEYCRKHGFKSMNMENWQKVKKSIKDLETPDWVREIQEAEKKGELQQMRLDDDLPF